MIDLYPLARPLLHALDPELAHRLTIDALRLGLGPTQRQPDDPVLRVRFGPFDLPNPLGMAAGFDKDADVPEALLALGFGHVETGTVTPAPQPGNPRPRLFRVPTARAVINRYGFNSRGLERFAGRFEALRRHRRVPGVVGANIGKNKLSEAAGPDYVAGIRRLAPLADYITINVSSPNTPGLRALQGRDALAELLGLCLEARRAAVPADRTLPPLLLKVAPDLTEADEADIAEVAMRLSLDGLIVSNTTITRPVALPPELAGEAGGFSGPPLMAASTALLARLHRRTGGTVPLIGVGGVASGADAYRKIRAGASLVQLYTALVYDGPALVGRIKRELAALLRADGFASVAEAVGADAGSTSKEGKAS